MNSISNYVKPQFVNIVCKRMKKFFPECYVSLPKTMMYDENCDRKPPLHPETPRFQDEYALTKPKGVVYDKKPFKMCCEPGKVYWWCSCGLSKEQPFCDGHHKRVLGNTPTFFVKKIKHQPIKVVFDKRTEVWWCNCKQSNNRPFCDGSHLTEFVQTVKIN